MNVSTRRHGTLRQLLPDRSLVRVAVVFAVLFVIMQAALSAAVLSGAYDPVMQVTATLLGEAGDATGVRTIVQGADVFLSNRILRIDPDCTGVTLVMIYAALVLAYPLHARRKLIGLAAGIPVILIANFLRLLAVVHLSGMLEDRTFLFAHDYLFKIVMMAVVIVAWAAYLASARRHAQHS